MRVQNQENSLYMKITLHPCQYLNIFMYLCVPLQINIAYFPWQFLTYPPSHPLKNIKVGLDLLPCINTSPEIKPTYGFNLLVIKPTNIYMEYSYGYHYWERERTKEKKKEAHWSLFLNSSPSSLFQLQQWIP